MKAFLIRHAHAVDQSGHLDDGARYLNARGRKVARQVGVRLREEAMAFDAVLTSPLVRAVQTAELVAEGIGFSGVVEAMPALAPGAPIRLVVDELAGAGGSVALVGHEPGISMVAAMLSARPTFPAFAKGQVCLIEDGRWTWLLDPDTLAARRLV